jgi:hypothetical protein
MATPFVAGALAVLMSAHPTETHMEIRDRLFSGVNQVAALDGITVTGGRINFNNSITGSYPDFPDDDQDDVPNWTDNCRDTYNPGQEDGDGDGIGDACDSQYSGVTNAEAAIYGSGSLVGSGATNSLGLLLVPVGVVIGMRFWRRRK